MREDLKEFLKIARVVRLTQKERLKLYVELRQFIKDEQLTWEFVRNNHFLRLIYKKPMLLATLSILLLATPVGLAIASQNSSQGDLLYPVKTQIVEPVKKTFGLSIGVADKIRLASPTPKADSSSSVEGKMKAAENKILEVQAFIDLKKSQGADTIKALGQLSKAQQTLVDGKMALEANNFNLSFTLFDEAQKQAQEAKLLVETETQIEAKREKQESEGGKTESGKVQSGAGIGSENKVETEDKNSRENKSQKSLRLEGDLRKNIDINLPGLFR